MTCMTCIYTPPCVAKPCLIRVCAVCMAAWSFLNIERGENKNAIGIRDILTANSADGPGRGGKRSMGRGMVQVEREKDRAEARRQASGSGYSSDTEALQLIVFIILFIYTLVILSNVGITK